MSSKFVENAEVLWQETEMWKQTWHHKKPCEEWEQNYRVHGSGFCKHYVNARYKKFGQKIRTLFELTDNGATRL
ncbi:hypothetical protein M1590_04135 [Candidatus Marsarchaeota archaeon]|nr:hypothetical protein [Candidatus Marsarchaeota archaeon]